MKRESGARASPFLFQTPVFSQQKIRPTKGRSTVLPPKFIRASPRGPRQARGQDAFNAIALYRERPDGLARGKSLSSLGPSCSEAIFRKAFRALSHRPGSLCHAALRTLLFLARMRLVLLCHRLFFVK